MARKASKILSAAEKRTFIAGLRSDLKDEKQSLSLLKKLVTSAKKELRASEAAVKKQQRAVDKAAKTVAKATGK